MTGFCFQPTLYVKKWSHHHNYDAYTANYIFVLHLRRLQRAFENGQAFKQNLQDTHEQTCIKLG